ncbi:MAG: bifunctional 3,4-dihydroxy-2-butanone-4-phosphate synthase/GTP cyclohydrolase II [Gammaproteobacteria bacterium]|nr:bifunctional 3,4-dihydroxy-2-butanone-4-phosphate synthase/GTP cyclohydrolase II [Gammaproteobacteria bacterium]MDH5239395.1 bifunctional 3,4-dihydroxy-2-butanone-4-phosphate synthase/GTP cyclohydrolase II [Gammaproteobacteria bacterium]MDH5260519.1 bifunctional 3,4-dihydroxy-2-butanone-4-phosphate synthase/GTP cyclohydrolase II [Gammaproteobacteria bacterium]MDH5584071.1 bifunctional 3,4-dihydroxy-2-butanone-4-phosphate synthase/GTP cyclohydrolase II [Gammaproteobacteria bacterium]
MPDNTTRHPSAVDRPFSKITDIIADLRDGKMVIMVDDEHRENEGDLIMAAAKVRPEDINYMATHGRGLVCLTLSRERCRQLRLPLMVSDTDHRHATNFTLSIEAAEGITTGISAHDRAHTIQTAVAPDARPEHLSQPGHIFPVMAQPGGVLTRAGHTEAGCDLARLAGLEPAAAIVEILNEDGSMARRPDLEIFARKHGIRIGTIADLIRYRLDTEKNVERIGKERVQTEYGDFDLYCYDDHVNRAVHVALVKGDLKAVDAPLVRVHLQDTLGDVIGVQSPSLGWPLRSAVKRIAEEEVGVVVLLRDQETSRKLMDVVETLGQHRDELEKRRAGDEVLRTYGIGAQILRDLGLSKIRVLSAPKQMYAISGFDLEITEYV